MSWVKQCADWHTKTMAKYKTLTIEQLEYIRRDAYEAAKIADANWNNEKAGQYWDEVHYASMELKSRQNK